MSIRMGDLLRFRQLRQRREGGKGRFYRKSLMMLLLVSGIPGLVIGALVYWFGGERVESELLQLHNRQIEQRASNMDQQLSTLELMLSHWAFDPKFDYTLNGLDFVKDYERARDITKTLLVMQGSNNMVKRVELYLDGEQPLLFDTEYSLADKARAEEVYGKLLATPQVTFWTQWAFDPARPDAKELTLVHHIPGGSQPPFGELIIRLDPEKVAGMLRTMMPYDGGEALLLRDNGELFASAGSGDGLDETFLTALREKIGSRKTAKDSFFFDWNGATYTVSYGQFTRIASTWTYVSASPITSITSPVVFLSKMIFLISGVSLLLAGVLAWLASRSIYMPVGRLMKLLTGEKVASEGREDEFALIERQWQHLHRESRELSVRLAEQLPHVKESFLQQLLQGYLYAYSEDDLLKRMEQYRWEVQDRIFVILHIRLAGITGLDGKFRYGDEGLATFAAVNIIGELAERHFDQSDTINFHDLTAGLLVTVSGDSPWREALQLFCGELTQAVNQILKMRVTIAVSRPVDSVSDIPLAYEGAQHAARYRNWGSDNQILLMEQMAEEEGPGAGPPYPFTLERELIQAMRTGRAEETEELLSAFLEALSTGGAKEIDVQQGMLHLLGSIQHAIMVSGIQPNRLFKGANLYAQLSEIRDPKLYAAWFREKVTGPFLKELLERSDTQVKRMIEEAMIYLQTHYMKDISLDSCADHTGTNPFFLSKSFKQVTGKNFIDYLTELRLEKAKELLRESELRINDVAEQVGYQHSYFNRIFKKLEGMTPTRYREMSRSG
ncbi:helix-turn-helix domain-containing protein [Gorillibacterium sp. sgz5001074]|uniref:helix-turn-helix domain-containing protein n=1 Tax=Gorillibacterium sp. sgz5001074 TaxID=3446695 RepID=UPI003F6713AB